MENKNIETPSAEQRTLMQNEIVNYDGEIDQGRVDTIMAQASKIAVEQISSEGQNILVEATQGTEAQDTGVVIAEAELSAQQLQELRELDARALAGDWDQDRYDEVKASLIAK